MARVYLAWIPARSSVVTLKVETIWLPGAATHQVAVWPHRLELGSALPLAW